MDPKISWTVDAGNQLGVFGSNKKRPFHRWYPFIEGYSADLVSQALAREQTSGLVFDPFGGSGTTALVASMHGLPAEFCEVNPFMAWAADVKINQARDVWHSDPSVSALKNFDKKLSRLRPSRNLKAEFLTINAERNYFNDSTVQTIFSVLNLVDQELHGASREVARLAVASSLIPSSNMIRRTDLRRRTERDKKPQDFMELLRHYVTAFMEDIEEHGHKLVTPAKRVGVDARSEWVTTTPSSLIVTSPPYLNGTNYCRNTKLELLTLGFIQNESDLSQLRTSSISAGINNVSARRVQTDAVHHADSVIEQLSSVSYDKRIPVMIQGYFEDMKAVFQRVRSNSAIGASMHFDIGDSKYSGVHVPTHVILQKIAEDCGWRTNGSDLIRKRRSHDGTELCQVVLHFEAV